MFKINLQSISKNLFYFLLVFYPYSAFLGFAFALKTGYIFNAIVLLLFLLVVNKLSKIDIIILFTILLSFLSVVLLKVLVTDSSMDILVGMLFQMVIIFYYYISKGLFAGDNINIKKCTNLIINGALFQAFIGIILFYFLRGFDLLLIFFHFDIAKFSGAGGSINRASGFLLNSNIYANYLLIGIVLLILSNDKIKLGMLFKLLLLFIAILASGSRYAVVVAIIFIISVFINKLSLKSALIFLLVFVLMLVFVAPIVNSIYSSKSYFYEDRASKNMIALNALNSNFIHYIVGVPNTDMLIKEYDRTESFSDNSYLSLILTLGLPLTLYILFIIVIKPLLKIVKNNFSVLFAIYMIVLLFITNCIYWYFWCLYIYFIIFFIDHKNVIREKEKYCEE